MRDYRHHIKMKRFNGNVYEWKSKIYIPVAESVKRKFEFRSRLYDMSQAELGAVIVMHYLENPLKVVQAIRRYKQVQRELRKNNEFG